MKNERIIKIVAGVVIAVLLFLLGMFAGRKTVKGEVKIETEYITLPPVHDTLVHWEPVTVIHPADTADIIRDCVKNGIYSELFPEKLVTEYIEISKEDTAAALKDWATARYYSATIFDIDTIGKCDVSTKVQYNRLDSFSYSFTPVQKTVTITKYDVKKYTPFIGVGMDINNLGWSPTFDIQAEAGMFIKEKNGFAVDYRYDFLTQTHSVGALYLHKF